MMNNFRKIEALKWAAVLFGIFLYVMLMYSGSFVVIFSHHFSFIWILLTFCFLFLESICLFIYFRDLISKIVCCQFITPIQQQGNILEYAYDHGTFLNIIHKLPMANPSAVNKILWIISCKIAELQWSLFYLVHFYKWC